MYLCTLSYWILMSHCDMGGAEIVYYSDTAKVVIKPQYLFKADSEILLFFINY